MKWLQFKNYILNRIRFYRYRFKWIVIKKIIRGGDSITEVYPLIRWSFGFWNKTHFKIHLAYRIHKGKKIEYKWLIKYLHYIDNRFVEFILHLSELKKEDVILYILQKIANYYYKQAYIESGEMGVTGQLGQTKGWYTYCKITKLIWVIKFNRYKENELL